MTKLESPLVEEPRQQGPLVTLARLWSVAPVPEDSKDERLLEMHESIAAVFCGILRMDGWTIGEYDSQRWVKDLPAILQSPDKLMALSVRELRELLTYCYLSEMHSEGLILGMAKRGEIQKILNRLVYLVTQPEASKTANRLTELQALTALAQAWNRLDATGFIYLLAPDAGYYQMQLSPGTKDVYLGSKIEIAEALTANMQMLKDSNQSAVAELVQIISGAYFGRNALSLSQSNAEGVLAVAVLDVEGGHVRAIQIRPPCLMMRTGLFPS